MEDEDIGFPFSSNNINLVYEISENEDFIIELIINKNCLTKKRFLK